MSEKKHEVENAYDAIYNDMKDDAKTDIPINDDLKKKAKNFASKAFDKLDKWSLKHPNAFFITVIGGAAICGIELTKKILSDSIYSANKKTIRYIDKKYRR